MKKRDWMNCASALVLEWKQAMDEGKDVKRFEGICKSIAAEIGIGNHDETLINAAEPVLKAMLEAPVQKGYPFAEPSDLEGIRKAKPQRRHDFKFSLTSEQYKEKLKGAWIGRISGCLLGKPVEGILRERLTQLLKLTDNYPMHKYICKKDFNEEAVQLMSDRLTRCWADNINGMAPVDDDTNYTVLALKLIETYGMDFVPDHVLDAWLEWLPIASMSTAEHIAYRNAAMGMGSPKTATYQNPCREWIGAQIRGDFFGYINPANPEMAAEMAWRDASVSHVKNGIYGEMFVAAAIAAACVCNDVMKVVEAGLDEIPQKCRLRQALEQVVRWYGEGLSETEVTEEIHKRYDENDPHGWCHTNSNAMIVVMALLYGSLDFGKSLCLAVQPAFDTDCNGATVGSIVGMMLGANAIPEEWSAPYNGKLLTSISGYSEVTVEILVEKTLLLCGAK